MNGFMGTMQNFFGGSFFVQADSDKQEQIKEMLPQLAQMDDEQVVHQLAEVTEMDEQKFLSEIQKDYGWDKSQMLS